MDMSFNQIEPQQFEEGFQEITPQINTSEDLSVDERLRKLVDKNRNQQVGSLSDLFLRNAAQNTSRAAETVLGLPGNVKKAYQQSTDFLDSLIPEGLPKLNDIREGEKEALYTPDKRSLEGFVMSPPTSEQWRKGSKNLSKRLTGRDDYLEPQNNVEKAIGEFSQDLASFFLPGTGQLRMLTRIGAPLVGNLGKQALTFLGADEETAEKAKLGLMLATTLGTQSNPGQFARDRIAQAVNMVPETATAAAAPLASRLMNLYTRVTRGLSVPSKSRAVQGMQDLAGQVDQNGRIPLRSLMQARDDVNEWLREAGAWNIPATDRKSMVANLNELKTQIIRTIDENLAQRFPQAGELYKTGYQASAVTQQSNAISNFIENNFGKKAASIGAKLLFPSLGISAGFVPKLAALGTAATPVYKVGQVLYRIGQSPTLSRYYQGVLQAATQGNAPAMIRNLTNLDKGLAHEEKKMDKKRKPTVESFKAGFINKSR